MGEVEKVTLAQMEMGYRRTDRINTKAFVMTSEAREVIKISCRKKEGN